MDAYEGTGMTLLTFCKRKPKNNHHPVNHSSIVQQGRHEDLIGQKGIYADFVLGRREAAEWKIQTSK